MKLSILVFAIVLSSISSFARSCYVAKQTVYTNLPKVICLDSLNLNQNDGSVFLTTDLNAATMQTLKTTSYSRHTEDVIGFIATLSLISSWNGGCFQGESADIIIGGKIDSRYAPEVNTDDLSVTLVYQSTNDTCHSEATTETFEYLLTNLVK
ncbi:MAG: hypothetical protein WA160_07750 [Pseudobdellovibrio sp.]